MGRVKDFYWDEINAAAENAPCEPDPPDEQEMAEAFHELEAARLAKMREQKQEAMNEHR